ncbi:MAG: caspase family protein [Myxococcaceae bacterium]|nr:caspase family protein [Myxococcaceae bacterium]
MLRSTPIVLLFVAGLAAAEPRRLAIVVGNNAGSGELPPLRYAESDAGKFARVMAELGSVATEDVVLLQGRHGDDLERAFASVRETVRAEKPRGTVLFFYFSGHSDGESLEIGPDRLSYVQLRALLEGTGADARVAVVDACKSGAGLRAKGGKATEAFTLQLHDELQARGEVFISSASDVEVAHESREVMGGLFTHHLLSGLRGAADANNDKSITLFEAYRYAYERTLYATGLITPTGGQHAAFDYRLSGRGELTLTSLSAPPARLEVPAGVQRVMVRDLARDQIVAELGSNPTSRELALAPGRYALHVTKDGQTRNARFTLTAGGAWRPEFNDLPAPGPVLQSASRLK